MIKISKFTRNDSPDAEEDTLTDHDCSSVREAFTHFDQSAHFIIARCSDDKEYAGMLFGVRRVNNRVAEVAFETVEPGKQTTGMCWQFKGQLIDPVGSGWRVLFAREETPLKKPAAPKAEEPKPEEARS